MGGRLFPVAAVLLALVSLSACGSTTDLERDLGIEGGTEPQPSSERCNGLDDDFDGRVDEDFRGEQGLYIDDDHCGGCNRPCADELEGAENVACELIDGVPACVATACRAGFVRNSSGRCVDPFSRLCLPCLDDNDCGDFAGASCMELGGVLRCASPCGSGCPSGYTCGDAGSCIPDGGSCDCDPGDDFDLACVLRPPDGAEGVSSCVGLAQCVDGVLSVCEAPDEVCDGLDNNCDGVVDEGFRDARGAYSLDVQNCGACGIDCGTDSVPGGLSCGGDPLAPSCVLNCPDGFRDADRDLGNGCECAVLSETQDPAGPPKTFGSDLDINCDGADGIVVSSIYVAVDGDDGAVGSPTRPLRTVTAAMELAEASRDTAIPRPDVYVAAGVYAESVTVPNGVRLHGGYRRDFLGLDPDAFPVELRAPLDGDALGGAALRIEEAGASETVVEWLTLTGADAGASGEPAFAALLRDPGAQLRLSDLIVQAGRGGRGAAGDAGTRGAAPESAAGDGVPQRTAAEDASRACISGAANRNAGGAGGRARCGGRELLGGSGGSASCPRFGAQQGSGSAGGALSGSGGAGGRGGNDTAAPIVGGPSCPGSVCCGLPDFTVPAVFLEPDPGRSGENGRSGNAGRGCLNTFGRLEVDGATERWLSDAATGGTSGRAGTGGGGGGAGGGVQMDFVVGQCELPDGLGGSGGGGGAPGCGGAGGEGGVSGGPSVGIAVVYSAAPAGFPSLDNLDIRSGDGGRGGDGGSGGDGGPGGVGGRGGALADVARSNLSLSASFPGREGGRGGDGGDGGGGGGGCGGGVAGVWVHGLELGETPAEIDAWRGASDFVLGDGGDGGAGGAGAASAADGLEGEVADVIVR